MITILNKEYPLQKDKKYHVWLTFALSIWIFVFLWFPEPFELDDLSVQKKLAVIPFYGLFGGLSYVIALSYQIVVFKKHEKWTISNEIICLFFALSVASFFMYCVYYSGIENKALAYSYVNYTLKIYLPSLIIIAPFIGFGRLLIAKWFAVNNNNDTLNSDKIIIKGKGKQDFIRLKNTNLVYIMSSDNYVKIYYVENQEMKSKLIRGSLFEIEKQFPWLLKTHRSYIINPNHFKHFTKQNNTVTICLSFGIEIPVSRSMYSIIKQKLPFTTK